MDTHAASSPKLVQSKYNPNLMVDKSLSVYMINGREIYEYFPELSYLREERFFANLARLEAVPQAAFGNMLSHLNRILTAYDGIDLAHEIFRFTNFYFNHDWANTIDNENLMNFAIAEFYSESIVGEVHRKGYLNELIDFMILDFPSIYPSFLQWIKENTNTTDFLDILKKTRNKEDTKVYFDMFMKHKAKDNNHYALIYALSGDNILDLINTTSWILIKYWNFEPKKYADFIDSWQFSLGVIQYMYFVKINSIFAVLAPNIRIWKSNWSMFLSKGLGNQDWIYFKENIKNIIVNMVLEKDPEEFEYYHGKLPKPKN